MINRIGLLGVVLALAACVTTGEPAVTKSTQSLEQIQKIEYGCEAYATSLDVLTVANRAGKLTAAQQSAILNAAGRIAPVCEADEVPTLSSVAMAAFLEAVNLLQTRASAVK